MNLITIELCAEDRARIDKLTETIERFLPPTMHLELPDAVVTRAAVTPETAPEPEHIRIDETLQPDPAPVVTEAEIRMLARSLIESGKKAQLKELVNKYAPSITDIPSKFYSRVYDELKALSEA